MHRHQYTFIVILPIFREKNCFEEIPERKTFLYLFFFHVSKLSLKFKNYFAYKTTATSTTIRYKQNLKLRKLEIKKFRYAIDKFL